MTAFSQLQVHLIVCSKGIQNHLHEMKPEVIDQTSPIAFQFLYMMLTIDITDGRDLSNEARHEFLPR